MNYFKVGLAAQRDTDTRCLETAGVKSRENGKERQLPRFPDDTVAGLPQKSSFWGSPAVICSLTIERSGQSLTFLTTITIAAAASSATTPKAIQTELSPVEGEEVPLPPVVWASVVTASVC